MPEGKELRPRFTRRQAECLLHLAEAALRSGFVWGDLEELVELVELLGTPERVKAAQEGADRLRRSVFGPPQTLDEEAVEARYRARMARRRRQVKP